MVGSLPPARRRTAAFRRPQGHCSGGRMAHYCGADGLAEPRRRRFQLFTLDERSEELTSVDFRDTGNSMRASFMPFPRPQPSSAAAGLDGCSASFRPPHEPAWRSDPVRPPRWACCSMGWSSPAFATAAGPTPSPCKASLSSAPAPVKLRSPTTTKPSRANSSSASSRPPSRGPRTDPLFRLQPERWLESRLRDGMSELCPPCAATCSIPRCPRFLRQTAACSTCSPSTARAALPCSSSRPRKTCTCPCRPWTTGYACARSTTTASRAGGDRPLSAFERQGYFAGTQVSPLPPRLLLAARPCASTPPTSRCCATSRQGGVGADRGKRTLAAGIEGGISQTEWSVNSGQ